MIPHNTERVKEESVKAEAFVKCARIAAGLAESEPGAKPR